MYLGPTSRSYSLDPTYYMDLPSLGTMDLALPPPYQVLSIKTQYMLMVFNVSSLKVSLTLFMQDYTNGPYLDYKCNLVTLGIQIIVCTLTKNSICWFYPMGRKLGMIS